MGIINRKALGFHSGLEEATMENLKSRGVKYEYESMKIPYVDDTIHYYTPDFILPNGIIIETKGYFTPQDRVKHLRIKKQYPIDYHIRFVFKNSKNRLSSKSKTTYGMWCEKYGFLYADGSIPDAWIKEKKRKPKEPLRVRDPQT